MQLLLGQFKILFCKTVDEGVEIGEEGSIAPVPVVEDTSRTGQSQQEDFLDVGEKIVGPGDILHLPTVRTAIKQGVTKSFIIVRVSFLPDIYNMYITFMFSFYLEICKFKQYFVSCFPFQLVNYLEKDWSCSTQIPDDPQDVEIWTFNSYDSVSKMSMQLGVK